MKTHLFLLFAATQMSISISAQADLLVYRETERAHVTGAGREVTVPVTTFIVYDTATGSIDAIGAFKVGPNRVYVITNSLNYLVTQGIAGRRGTYTVLAQTANTNNDPNTIVSTYFAKGRDSTLELGNANTAHFPRSFKAMTRSVQISSGQLATYESSSTVLFQSTETKTANAAGESAATVVERIRQRLEAQGYVPAS